MNDAEERWTKLLGIARKALWLILTNEERFTVLWSSRITNGFTHSLNIIYKKYIKFLKLRISKGGILYKMTEWYKKYIGMEK